MNLKHTLVATAVHQSVQPPAPDPDSTSIRTEGERVVVRFPRPVIWLGLSRDEALQFSAMVASAANEIPLPEVTATGEQPYVPNT